MCNITLTRRRGSRPDGARLTCRVIQYSDSMNVISGLPYARGIMSVICRGSMY